MPKVYISGALTSIPRDGEALKIFYERLGALCEALGYESYVPHLKADPIKFPGFTPSEVYEMDSAAVIAADLMIAYVGLPSLGVGQELEIAREHSIPIILLMEQGATVSRMARGNPLVIREIRFSSYEEVIDQLPDLLCRLTR